MTFPQLTQISAIALSGDDTRNMIESLRHATHPVIGLPVPLLDAMTELGLHKTMIGLIPYKLFVVGYPCESVAPS